MYCISWATGFEIGLGDFDGGTPGNLTRATVLASSNAGALVALPGGTKDVFAVFDPAAREVVSISGTATLALADLGNTVVFSGASAATLNLPAVATVPNGAGWLVLNSGTAALTIDPNGAEQVNGASTLVLQPGASAMLMRNGAAWSAANMENATPEVDIASAATTNIGATTSRNVRITGTTTIASFGTAANGIKRNLRFAGALTLTHNATSLILPGGANIATAAGDTAEAVSLGSGNWVLVNYQPATQAGMRLLSGTAPLPKTGVGVGEWVSIGSAVGAALALPAGGTWAYWMLTVSNSGTLTGNAPAGVAAGGTTLAAASAGFYHIGFCWRVA
jgi:hypothetical protein